MIRDIKLFNFQENSSHEKVLYRARNLSDKIFLNKENYEYKCLTSDFLTTGPFTLKFEKKFSSYVGSKYALTCSSGTASLHLAFLAIGLKKKIK